jgi:hypothetical protein
LDLKCDAERFAERFITERFTTKRFTTERFTTERFTVSWFQTFDFTNSTCTALRPGGGKKRKKKTYTKPKKIGHKNKKVKLAFLKLYKVDGGGFISLAYNRPLALHTCLQPPTRFTSPPLSCFISHLCYYSYVPLKRPRQLSAAAKPQGLRIRVKTVDAPCGRRRQGDAPAQGVPRARVRRRRVHGQPLRPPLLRQVRPHLRLPEVSDAFLTRRELTGDLFV